MKKKLLLFIAILLVPMYLQAQEQGYALFDSGTATLTFKYGVKPSVDNVFETDDTGLSLPGWLGYDSSTQKYTNAEYIKHVVFDASFAKARPKSTFCWFYNCYNLVQIDMQNLNTSEVTNMGYMFYGCSSLTSIDLSKFNTSTVKEMSGMFRGCSSLTGIELNSFNTANVISMKYMFYGCSSLLNLDLSNYNTEKVTSTSNMFNGCNSLMSLDLSNFNTESITEMESMFRGCSSLTNIDLSMFDTKNVTDMRWMFDGCKGLNNLNLSNFNTGKVTNMWGMFSNCSGLTSLDISSFNTINVTDMGWMFSNCSGLTNLELSSLNTANVTILSGMFHGCSGLTSLDFSKFDTEKVTDISNMFEGCGGLMSLDISSFNTANVKSLHTLFWECSSLTDVIFGINFNTGSVTEIPNMFYQCTALANIWFTGDIPSNVRSDTFSGVGTVLKPVTLNVPVEYLSNYKKAFDGGMFYGGYFTLANADTTTDETPKQGYCIFDPETFTLTFKYGEKPEGENVYDTDNTGASDPGWLGEIDGSTFRNSIAQNIKNIVFDSSFAAARPKSTKNWFRNCYKVTEIDLEYLNTSEVTNMDGMFYSCSGLTSLDFSKFNTEKVTTMGYMFYGCRGLKSLDVSTFNTTNVTNMIFMFIGCSSLTKLDLSSFDTEKVTNMGYMFQYCSNLTDLIFSSHFITRNSTSNVCMFSNCSALSCIWFTGNKPSSMKYNIFNEVGSADKTVMLNVAEEYKSIFESAFSGGKLCEGYFTLTSESGVLLTNGYATFYNGIFDVALPETLIAMAVKDATDNKLVYEIVAKGGKTVPAGTAVLLCGPQTAEATVYTLTYRPKGERYTGDNLLHGSDWDAITTGGNLYFKLMTDGANFGWYWGASDGKAFISKSHEAWLAIIGSGDTRKYDLPINEDSEMSQVIVGRTADAVVMGKIYYDMVGRRIEGYPMVKGLYVNENGQKFIIK